MTAKDGDMDRVTDLAAFEASLEGSEPVGLTPALRAVWHAMHGDWDAAHRIVQSEEDADSAWVHACLHREEGDLGNARYWYNRAGHKMPEGPTRAELGAIAEALLAG